MARKRTRETGDGTASDKRRSHRDEEESSDDEDFDVVNVDFEWFNFDADIDFHGVRTLLRQLFGPDAALLDISALADVVLRQATIGSTVKVDGKASDAYAFVTVLNLPELLRDGAAEGSAAVAKLVQYLAERAQASGESAAPSALGPVAEALQTQLPAGATDARVGLVLADRLINMPSEIAPPMFSMLVEEVQDAVDDGEPYGFTHYLVVSKTYWEVQSTLDAGEGDGTGERKSKKARESKAGSEGAVFYFHPEDEVLQRHAVAHGSYEYCMDDESVADSKRAFQDMGIKSFGSLILLEAAKFGEAVEAIGEYLGSGSA